MPAAPTPEKPLRLGTRRSPLALAQAEEARARLCAAHSWSADCVQLVPVTASGDRIQDRPLAEIGGKALWTRELDLCLADGRIDGAVHSLKDVETLRPDGLTIAAVLPREDKADVLLGARAIAALPQGAVIGTSAPRRAAQLLHQRPDCTVVTFRGNVATRLAKLAAGEVQATFLAIAGLARLGETGVGTRLDPEEWLPAPSQAAIGIECRSDDAAMRGLLAVVDHAPSRAEVMAERALLAALGGSCHSAVACLTQPRGDGLVLRAALFSPDGAERVMGEAQVVPDVGITPVRALAADLLARAPASVRDSFQPPA
jgi:hydroxymethylbilane synthase